MIEQKGTYGAIGGLHHAGIHGLGTTLILLIFVNPVAAMLSGLLDAGIHYHIDWAKTNLSQGYTPTQNEFWFWLGLDQTLHYLTYIAIIATLFLL